MSQEILRAPFYIPWKLGDPKTDQRTAPKVGAKLQQSGLVEWGNGIFWDDEYAFMVRPVVVRERIPMVHAFAQCFGGGFHDDLNLVIPGFHAAGSATRYDEVAFYPTPAKPVDWAQGYIDALNTPRPFVPIAEQLTREASRLDMFQPVNEQPVYWRTVPLANNINITAPCATKMAVIWSGQPNKYDAQQVKDLITALVVKGKFRRDQIYLFYANGNLLARHPIKVAHVIGKRPPIKIAAADKKLVKLLFRRALTVFPKKPEVVFFFANDHGANNSVRGVIRPKEAQPGDPNGYPDEDIDRSSYGGETDFTEGLGACPDCDPGDLCQIDDCSTITCDSPGPCQSSPGTCSMIDGSPICSYGAADAGTLCGDGVCNGAGTCTCTSSCTSPPDCQSTPGTCAVEGGDLATCVYDPTPGASCVSSDGSDTCSESGLCSQSCDADITVCDAFCGGQIVTDNCNNTVVCSGPCPEGSTCGDDGLCHGGGGEY